MGSNAGQVGRAHPPIATGDALYNLCRVTKFVGDSPRRAILDQISCTIGNGEICGLSGESGAGKSTLLQILGAIDRFDEGEITFRGVRLMLRSRTEMAHFRRGIGFVFQAHYLIPHHSVYDNVALPLRLVGIAEQTIYARVIAALQTVNLLPRRVLFESATDGRSISDDPALRPFVRDLEEQGRRGLAVNFIALPKMALGALQRLGAVHGSRSSATAAALVDAESWRRLRQQARTLSGGERQRVAVARAFVHEPAVVLADEPTASLDAKNEAEVLHCFQELQATIGGTVVIASHSERVLGICSRVLTLKHGALVDQRRQESPSQAEQPEDVGPGHHPDAGEEAEAATARPPEPDGAAPDPAKGGAVVASEQLSASCRQGDGGVMR